MYCSRGEKEKGRKADFFDFQAFLKEPKFLVFVEQKVDNKIWKGFTLALCQREDLGASVEAFPFAEIPKKKAWLSFASIFGSIQYLRLFWSDCSHWKGYFLTISSLIEMKKNYFISFWSANAVLLEVQGLLSSNTKTSSKNNTTQIQLQKKTYAAVLRQLPTCIWKWECICSHSASWRGPKFEIFFHRWEHI